VREELIRANALRNIAEGLTDGSLTPEQAAAALIWHALDIEEECTQALERQARAQKEKR
jgi:hypothetical protein